MRAELAAVEATCRDIPIVIGGQEIRNDNVKYQVSPYNHQQKIAKYYWADEALLKKAADAAVAAQVRLAILCSLVATSSLIARVGAPTSARSCPNLPSCGRNACRTKALGDFGDDNGGSGEKCLAGSLKK